jgi:hypothetical protein
MLSFCLADCGATSSAWPIIINFTYSTDVQRVNPKLQPCMFLPIRPLSVQVAKSITELFQRLTDRKTLPLPIQGKTLLYNVFIPWIIALEDANSSSGNGGGGLSPEAAANRRQMCILLLCSLVQQEVTNNTDILMGITLCLGTMLEETIGEAADRLGLVVGPTSAINQAPAVIGLLLKHYTEPGTDGKLKPDDWILRDPYMAPFYRARCCSVCGLLPAKPETQFQVCSLCKDPAAGQFCCKEPCFAAFWRGGHKNTCVGRDKMKKKGKAGGGGAGGSGVTET